LYSHFSFSRYVDLTDLLYFLTRRSSDLERTGVRGDGPGQRPDPGDPAAPVADAAARPGRAGGARGPGRRGQERHRRGTVVSGTFPDRRRVPRRVGGRSTGTTVRSGLRSRRCWSHRISGRSALDEVPTPSAAGRFP